MVNFMLMIAADLENLTNLQPQGGVDDPDFAYHFKVKCGNCGEASQKETVVSLGETISQPRGKGECHLLQKCKFCGRDGMITMIPGRGKPLTQELSESGQFAPLMLLECRGFEPVGFLFGAGWRVEAISGTLYENVDLSEDEFTEYDEKGEVPVMISNLRATFDVVK
uniref:CXXC motif containing zinc binding protein n=1 Tax=Kalanchoe fedtschenkoi TaxID=63787 RepID=A0A7N0UU09_KALFE